MAEKEEDKIPDDILSQDMIIKLPDDILSQDMIIKLPDDILSQDMISKLPDDILSEILSFLKLEEAVKTSILSKRWKKVWTLIHRISLDNDSSIRHPNFGLSYSYEEQMKRGISFINFVNGVLCGKNNNRILSVTSFRLFYRFGFQDDESSLITKWVDTAVSPNLENFDITLWNPKNWAYQVSFVNMPRALFECQKLVTLNLYFDDNFICLDVPETVCLPSPEMLRRASVKFKDENTLKNLLLGCQILEELYLRTIYDGHGRDQRNVFVFSPSLKILIVDHPQGPSDDGEFNPFCSNYVVEAPKLEKLNFVDSTLSGFTMTASPCIVSAVICVDADPKPLLLTSFFQGISNVQRLELRMGPTIILEDELANLPDLHNLIHLKINWCQNMDVIPCILQRSPHLKHLILSDDLFRSSYMTMWSPTKWVPECLTSQLEIIEIQVFRSSNEEEILKLVEYFLDNGKVLKKMVVTSFSDNQFVDKMKELLGADIRLCCFKK